MSIALCRWRACPLVAVACAAVASLVAASVASGAEPDAAAFFRAKIEPVLAAHCYECHSADAKDVQGGLRLDSKEGLRAGGDSGAVVVAGKPQSSLLLQALRHEGGLSMPPEKPKLAAAVIDDFRRWIERGAIDPRQEGGAADAKLEAARRHWAFQPVKRPAVPDVTGASSPIDAFVLQKLRERNWQPAPTATRSEWIRRVTFDLTGLPPTPDEINDYLSDMTPMADESLVDRLLASPHFGERAAQHWLDVVRYAESEGYEYDRHIPDAWRFRDYVTDSFNADKPFDRFVTEQLAGDEIGPEDAECLTASIFHRLGAVRRNAGNPDIALSRNEVLTERTDIVGTAFLGLTVGCARCHNHKLEPISQKDYYRLQAYFAATDERNISLASAAEQTAWEAETQKAKDEIQRLKGVAKTLNGAEKSALVEKIELLEDTLPGPLATIPATWNNFEKQTPIHVLRRGMWENKGEAVTPHPLSVLALASVPEDSADERNPRTQLARWIASPENPLTARVLVNRIWQQHFGTGLVRTANDFGFKGERPSHSELLDWLAATLLENGWRLKPIHRAIVLSDAYRQSSRSAASSSCSVEDPENRLLWKFPRRRLTAEEARDAMLAVSGRLVRRSGGPSVIVPVDPELVGLLYKPTQWAVTKDVSEHDRRSIYLIAKRNLRLPFLEILDAPALQTSCARRESSTHAPQALELLNGSLSNELARAFASRLQTEAGGNSERIVGRAFELALGRPPNTPERTLSLEFLKDQPLSEFALAIFNLNEFLYVP